MAKNHIPFLAFFILLITILVWGNFATAVVPGWHTTIGSPYFITGDIFIVAIVLFLIIIAYWLLSKRVEKINWVLFALHFASTAPIIIYLKAPFASTPFIFTIVALFVVSQVLFLLYFIKTIK